AHVQVVVAVRDVEVSCDVLGELGNVIVAIGQRMGERVHRCGTPVDAVGPQVAELVEQAPRPVPSFIRVGVVGLVQVGNVVAGVIMGVVGDRQTDLPVVGGAVCPACRFASAAQGWQQQGDQ